MQHIAGIIGAKAHLVQDAQVIYLVTDSRKIVFPKTSLFFALRGDRRDGHQFIAELYTQGVRNFVVSKPIDRIACPAASFLEVPDVLLALQQLAADHRKQFQFPVIGITGSNGKTIVKEWLYQLLEKDHRIVRSPRSYNSQIGVPLSVWQMQEQDELGIFEAGISTRKEMERLAAIIQPTTGVFTNIGDAHSQGFADQREKAIEKAKLFANVGSLIYCKDALLPYLDPAGADKKLFAANTVFFSWSRDSNAVFTVLSEEKKSRQTLLKATYKSEDLLFHIPFTDRISIDNVITCICVLLQLGYDATSIDARIQQLQPMDMRMQLKKGINNSYLVNDSYSNDTASLELALDYLLQQSGSKSTTLILSDILQSGRYEASLYQGIARQLKARGIGRLIGIGTAISQSQPLFTAEGIPATMYPSTDTFLQQSGTQQFRDEYILLKGARVFEFERISHWLEQKVHQTVMEINLTAMVHNLKTYQQHLKPSTKMMAMVKAFSYGSGSAEVAAILQFHKIDWLAVAYADEGVELRKAGISLPIMVMNADDAGFDILVNYGLEPEIYSFPLYHAFHRYLEQQGIRQFPVHVKFNTGMNRLGFETGDATELGKLLQQHNTMAVRSVFSHLAASEAAEHDAFTAHQVQLFKEACAALREKLGYDFIRHIANSASIIRNPDHQFDMVRLGIGLYGVDSVPADQLPLATVTVLRSTIAQVRTVKAGETVGYSRKGILGRDSRIATVRIGYADGYSRRLGNGKGKMFINGKLAPVVGSVCMDMTMIDVTDIPGVTDGDTVEIFGENLPVQELAAWADTIPYEVLTSISQRVKRVYWEE
jgi:alanine racemase